MDDIRGVKIEPLLESNYVKPLRMIYTQNGVEKLWDFNKIHDSVSILLFNTSRNVFVFVRQFRPELIKRFPLAVFFNSISTKDKYMSKEIDEVLLPPVEQGITLELCAGVVDKDKSLEEIAQEEILEECGYDVPIQNLERIISYRDTVGVAGDKQTFFYAEVTDEMKVSKGGGLEAEGEIIDVVEMSVEDVKKYIANDDVCSPAGFLFAVLWFLQNKRFCNR